MKRKSVFLIIILILTVITAALAGTTYGYFGALNGEDNVEFETGVWENIESAIKYMNDSDTDIEAGGETVSVLDYIAEMIWNDLEYDDNGNIVSGSISDEFADYTDEELYDLIDVMTGYVNNYLTADDNGELVFPDRINVSSAEIGFDTLLAAGESVQLQSMFLAANLSSEIYWSPVMYSISIEGANGEDISDFAVEVLFSSEYAQTFGYSYIFCDTTSYNNYRAQGSIAKNKNTASPVSSVINTDLSVYKLTNGSYAAAVYRHYLNVPSFGSWSRFIKGTSMELGSPSGSTIGLQQQLNSKNKSMNGLVLMGKANGTKTELRIQLYDRNTDDGNITNIPFLINVSRGVALDAGGNPLSYTASDTVPVIKVRLVSGDVWGS